MGPECLERPQYVSQGNLFAQMEKAFEPFSGFTPTALKAFVTTDTTTKNRSTACSK